MSDWLIVDLFDNYEFSVPGLFLCSIKGLFQFFSFTRVLRTNINFIIDFPLKTGHKLNVHNYFARRSGSLLNVLFASIYLLRPGVNPVDTGTHLHQMWEQYLYHWLGSNFKNLYLYKNTENRGAYFIVQICLFPPTSETSLIF